MRQRLGQDDIDFTCWVDSDGGVAPKRICLAIGVEKPSGCLPALTPFGFAELRSIEVVASVDQAMASANDSHPTDGELGCYANEPGLEHLETLPLLVKLGPGGVSSHPSPSPFASNGQGEPSFDGPNRPSEAGGVSSLIAPGCLPGIVGGLSYGTGPSATRLRRECLLPGTQECLSWSRPSRQRAAKSVLANRPRYAPNVSSTAASVSPRRSRVRMRTPVGSGTIFGRARLRSRISRMLRLLCIDWVRRRTYVRILRCVKSYSPEGDEGHADSGSAPLPTS